MECGAVDSDEGFLCSWAIGVDGAADEFFAGAGFSAHEDVGVGGADFEEGLPDLF